MSHKTQLDEKQIATVLGLNAGKVPPLQNSDIVNKSIICIQKFLKTPPSTTTTREVVEKFHGYPSFGIGGTKKTVFYKQY